MSSDPSNALEDIIRELRSNPEKYKELREKIEQAQSDEERGKALIDFVTSDAQLKRIAPQGGPIAGTGTVTVTTVLTPAGPPRS